MIREPYLLVMTLPCYLGEDGRRYLEELWHKDLVEHLSQIGDLTLAAPLEHGLPSTKVLPIDVSASEGILHHVDFPPCGSTLATLRHLPRITSQLWKAVGRARIVHSNAGGWPISFGWIAIPMAKLRGKFAMTMVESGSWRLGLKPPWRPKPLLQGLVFETMGRMIVNLSDMAVFTHAGYRDSMLLHARRHRGHVISASWINQKEILSTEDAESSWRDKLADPHRPLRVVFAASLSPHKGVLVLLDALDELTRRGVRVDFEMYGKGPLLDRCTEVARLLTGSVKMTLPGHLPYGEPFFRMLQGQDLMVVPSLSDEQPRIVYDSFARALPVVSTNTAGLLECVTDGLNGKVVPVNDPIALADAIEWSSKNRGALRNFGISALDVANSLTHEQMHARRADLIQAAIDRRSVTPSHA